MTFLLAILTFCATASALLADTAKIPPSPSNKKPSHPRLLFTSEELPAIRARAATPLGKQLMAALRHNAFGGRNEIAKAVMSNDPKFLESIEKDLANQWSRFANRSRSASLLYQLTNNAETGKIAAEMFRIWLRSFPDGKLDEKRNTWGSAEWALAYDWIYDLLDEKEKEKAEQIFAGMVGDRADELVKDAWYMEKTKPTGRQIIGGNWTALCVSNLGLTNLLLEQDKGLNQNLMKSLSRITKRYLNNAISPNGAMFEGMSYSMSNFGTHHLPLFLLAMRNRGTNLYKNSNMGIVPFWIAYETLPWGYEAFDINKSQGYYASAPFPTFIGKEFGSKGEFVYDQSVLVDNGILPDPTVALINGWPRDDMKKTPTPSIETNKPFNRAELPLTKWFSVKGSVFCRDGWGTEDTMLVINTNPIRTGHSHADHGSFCLVANGCYLISDSGISFYASKYHNVPHIDGLAMSNYGEGGNESFIRSVESNSYADIIDIDLKPAYDKLLFDTSGKYSFKGPWIWKPYNPMEYADRRVMFIRGVTGPIVIIADHFKKDSNARSYNWLVHTLDTNKLEKTPDGFRITERFGGKAILTLEQEKTARFVRNNVASGVYRGWLLIRGAPCVKSWASNNLSVNGVKVPYNKAYFGRGQHRDGWRWLPIQPNSKLDIPIKDGKIDLKITSNSGGMVALAVFTKDLNWIPANEIPRDSEEFIVFTMDQAIENTWDTQVMSQAVLDAVFLGPAPVITTKNNPKSQRQVVDAAYKADKADFLVVMVPHTTHDDVHLNARDADKRGLDITSPLGVDYVAGEGSKGKIETDAIAGCVSVIKEKTARFALAHGCSLFFDGKELVRATKPVQIINDGATITVRGEGGALVNCAKLGAKKLVVNGAEANLPSDEDASFSIPEQPNDWVITLVDDGAKVIVTGRGPQPLKIRAPQARECVVNGVSRYFTRDWSGTIYPVLESGTTIIQPSGFPTDMNAPTPTQ